MCQFPRFFDGAVCACLPTVLYQDEQFQEYSSLNAAITGGESAPISLVHMTFLEQLHRKDGRIQCRQELPEEAKFTGTIDDSVLLLALSYCWCEKGNPDPQGKVLADICRFTEYLEESRHFDLVGSGKFGIQDQLLVLFWDYLSLHQNRDGRPRTEIQDQSFKAGLDYVNVLYSGSMVCVSHKRPLLVGFHFTKERKHRNITC